MHRGTTAPMRFMVLKSRSAKKSSALGRGATLMDKHFEGVQ
jgi:hypothetical protein